MWAVSFSAASTVSLNDVFSATYDTYQIYTNLTSSSVSDTLSLRLRVGGADNTSSNYSYGQYYVGAVASIAAGSNNNTTTTSFQIGGSSATPGAFILTTLSNPFTTNYTKINTSSVGEYLLINGGITTVTTSYTGFTLRLLTGTMTGTVSVYGFNK